MTTVGRSRPCSGHPLDDPTMGSHHDGIESAAESREEVREARLGPADFVGVGVERDSRRGAFALAGATLYRRPAGAHPLSFHALRELVLDEPRSQEGHSELEPREHAVRRISGHRETSAARSGVTADQRLLQLEQLQLAALFAGQSFDIEAHGRFELVSSADLVEHDDALLEHRPLLRREAALAHRVLGQRPRDAPGS